MANRLPKLFWMLTISYVIYYHAYAAMDPEAECFGTPINLADEANPHPDQDFFGRFADDVVASRKSVNQKNDASCLVSPEIQGLDSNGLMLIDVRSPSANSGLAGSGVNIPLHELKTKEYLKKRHLILIDDRVRYFELLEECKSLIALGFQRVSILAGDSDILSNSNLAASGAGNFIDADDFFGLKQKWRWFVIDLTRDKYDAVSENLIRLSPDQDGSVLSSAIERVIENFYAKNGFYPNVLVIDQDGKDYSKFQDAAKSKYRSRIFYFKNGISGYRKFALQQSAILEQKKKIENRETLPCALNRH